MATGQIPRQMHAYKQIMFENLVLMAKLFDCLVFKQGIQELKESIGAVAELLCAYRPSESIPRVPSLVHCTKYETHNLNSLLSSFLALSLSLPPSLSLSLLCSFLSLVTKQYLCSTLQIHIRDTFCSKNNQIITINTSAPVITRSYK